MAAIFSLWSPNKRPSRGSANGTASEARGTKRKAKPNPYDDMDGDDDDTIPARKTPTSQRTARSRLSSSVTPGSSTKPRLSLPGRRRPGRPSLKSQQSDVPDTPASSRADATPSSARAKAAGAADTARRQPDSLVPEAPMGGLELLGNGAVDTPVSSALKPDAEVAEEPSTQEKGKAKQKEIVSARQAGGEEKEKDEEKDEEKEEEDAREVHEVARLLKHQMAENGIVKLLVQWVNEGEEDATWEAEEEIQQNAEEVLYEYWKAQGGRVNALFHQPRNAPPETYHVFRVLRHEKKNRGGFQFEVQWVGHPATRGETSMEAEPKLKNVAPELLQEYWESVGGRAKYLAPRGRAKKVRTE